MITVSCLPQQLQQNVNQVSSVYTSQSPDITEVKRIWVNGLWMRQGFENEWQKQDDPEVSQLLVTNGS